jgi:hypothetical protein
MTCITHIAFHIAFHPTEVIIEIKQGNRLKPPSSERLESFLAGSCDKKKPGKPGINHSEDYLLYAVAIVIRVKPDSDYITCSFSANELFFWPRRGAEISCDDIFHMTTNTK